MITKEEIQELLHSTETYRVERTTSTDERSKGRGQTRLYYALQEGRKREPTGDMDKFQEAICAFANDNGGKVGGKDGGKVGGDNVPSSSQVAPSLSQALSPVLSPVCPQLTDSLLTKISAVIVALSQQTCSISDLMEQTGEKNKNRFRHRYT